MIDSVQELERARRVCTWCAVVGVIITVLCVCGALLSAGVP